jgi:hypothetical protein
MHGVIGALAVPEISQIRRKVKYALNKCELVKNSNKMKLVSTLQCNWLH